jgi:SAM-dependent methyltransferase
MALPAPISKAVVIDEATIGRYRRNYSLDQSIERDHVQKHWELETRLTEELLGSRPEDRWETFERCYSTLYTELPWLNKPSERDPRQFRPWLRLVPRDATVFEVGSGKAELLHFLAANGRKCVATEITKERGSKHASDDSSLIWHSTDGVHLDQFEPPNSYDVVISTQVAEHFHPDDLLPHLQAVRSILRPGGRYLFDTPHRGTGPHDLSLVFGLDHAVCMHLREYTYVELKRALKDAGFSRIQSVFSWRGFGPIPSKLYLAYCCGWDKLIGWAHLPPAFERKLRRRLRWVALPSNIWLSAER